MAVLVGNGMEWLFPVEGLKMVHARPVPLCLLKNGTVPFAGKFSPVFPHK